MPSMDVRYRLSLNDHWQLQKYYYLRQRVHPAILYPFLVLIVITYIAGIFASIDKWVHHGGFDFVVFLSPIALLLYPWLLKSRLMGRVKSSPDFGNEVHLSIEEHFVMTATRTSEAKLAWSAIHEVVDVKDYIYIFTTKTYAVIVPKRAFPNEATVSAFFAAATAYRQNAVPGLALKEHTDKTSWPPTPRISN